MINKIEDFFFGKIAGRVVARVALSAGAWLASRAIAAGIHVDQNELSAALMTAGNAAYTWISEWRAKRAAAAAPKP
jgi:hypothetical protein